MDVRILRHLEQHHQHQHNDDDGTDVDIGLYEYSQVVFLDDVELILRQFHAYHIVHRTDVRLDRHGNQHADNRTQGIEGLSTVQTLDGVALAAQTVDVGVARHLQERQTAGQYEVC